MMNRYTRSIKYISKVKSLISVLVKGFFATVSLGYAAKSVISTSMPGTFIRNFKKSTILFATCLLMLLGAENASGATRTSTATGGVWATASTWVGGVAPATGDAVIIATTGANSVTVGANLVQTAAGSVTVNSGATLTLSNNVTLTFGAMTILSGGTVNVSRAMTVLGATNITGTINLQTTARAYAFNGDVTLNSGAKWNETVASTPTFAGNFTNNATTFTASTGVHTFTGTGKTISGTTITAIPSVTISGTTTNSGTLTVSTTLAGASTLTNGATGILNFAGTSITPTLTATAVGNTVNYNRANTQTVKPTTYFNLTLSGTNAKTTTGVTVNGVLSMEGTATASAAPTYGSAATLQYNTISNRTAGAEWISPFVATGGIVIANTGAITMNSAEIVNAPLTINIGSTLTPGANLLTLGDDFVNSGTFTSGSGGVTIAGTAAIQSIDGFTTTGLVSMTKTAGIATLQGNVNGAGLTINGSGGTLNLGTGLVHTFTGAISMNNGNLLGGSSTLNINGTITYTGGGWAQGTSTVNYGGAAQTVLAAPYYNLSLSGSGVKTLQSGMTIQNNFALSSTATATAVEGLTIPGDFSVGTGATFSASSYTHNIAGNWINTGTFNSNTSTVVLNGTTQSITGASTFNNLTLAGSGTKTFASTTTTNGVFTINSGVVANLGAFTHSANTLSLAGSGQPAGSWGGTGSAATFKNSTYFAPVVTGILNVATKSCTAGSWTGLISTDWNTANNWCDGTVPTASTNVIIPSGGNQPVIGAAGGLCNNITVNSGASLTITGSNTLTISGDWTNSGTFTPNTSTVTYNGASQAIAGVNYYNLTLSGSGTKTLQAGTTAIGGNFTLTGNSTTTTAVTGLTIGGNVYLESNTFFTSGAFTHNVGGNWTNNGWGATFTPGTGTVNFTGNSSAINGTNTAQNFNNIIVSKTAGQTLSYGGSTTSVTLNGDFTLTTGTFAPGANLIVTGNWNNNGGTFTPGTGIVTMNGTGKIIGGSTSTQFNGLTIGTGNNANISLGVDQTTVNGTLTLSNGVLTLGTYNLTLGPLSPAIVGGPWTWNGNMIVAVGTGELRKVLTGTGTYTFPVGDASNITPMTLNFTQGSYDAGAYAGVRVTNSKHPQNTSTTNYLKRYWSLSQSGIHSFLCTVTGTYVYGDVVGQENLQSAAEYTGSLPWVTYPVSLGLNTLSVAGVNAFGAFTGIETINITTSTISPSSFCPGSAVSVPFVIKGTYTAGNVFTAQLSDASGSFASPVNIGTLTATTSGTIPGTIPAGAVAGSGYRIRVVSSTPVITGTDNGANLTINTNSTAPTTTGGFICIGSTATLAASGAVTNEKYVWYNVATGGTALKTSTDNNDNTYTTAVLASTTNYWVSIMNAGGCEGPRTQVIATFPSVCTDPLTPGTDSWIGYIYGGRDTNFANNIYYGHYTEPETFNEGFGGDATCFGITSNSTPISIYTQNFSAKYLMNSTKKGLYVVDLGSDDGNRLTVDGTLLYNDWGDHALSSHPRVLMSLKGTSSLMYEYYENGGGNTVYFQNLTQVLGNTLTTNTTQTVLLGSTGAAISGDAYGTLPTGVSLSGTGYQWTYSTTPGGARTNIAGATGATFTPSNAIAPFNTAGTYYVYRNAVLSSTNNFGASPYVATNESNVATITIAAPGVSTSVSSLTGFSYVVGSGPSGEQSLNVVGIGLLGNVTVTPPADFEVSVLSGGVFQTTPLTLSAVGGVVNTTVYVRMKQGLTVGGYNSENIVLSAAGFTSKNVACSGIVIPGVTAGGGGSYCATNTITLTSSPNPPNITLTNVYWTGPNGFYSVLQNPTITNATTAMSGTYTVTGNYVPSGNLVVNGDFQLGNTGFTSSYTYRDSTYNSPCGYGALGCEGTYSVVANSHSLHSIWGSYFDHTPAPGTLQMVINGATTANVSVWSQTVAVLPNTSYQFTYWVQSVNASDPAPSQLQLYVNGASAGQVNTANSTGGIWKQFIYNWNSGSNTTALLSLLNQQQTAGGNDFALDDIVFQPVYTSSASVNVSVLAAASPASVSITASPGSSVNSGTSVTFTATPTSGGTAPVYQWQVNGANVGTNSPTYTYIPTDGNTVTCTMTSNSGCLVGSPTVTSNTITMAVNNPPNYWKGAYSTDWGTASNWTAGYVPGIGDNIIFSTVSTSGDALNNLILDKDRTVGNLTNLSSKQLIIPPAKCLTANGTITTDGNANKIYIQAWADGTQQNGSLIFHNDVSAPVYASVQMYSKATRDPSGVFDPVTNQTYHYSWQYFGIPLRSVVADPTFYGSFVRRNDEASTNTLGKWIALANSDVLTSFTGYEITQDAPTTFVFQGALENGDKSIALPYTSAAYDPGQTILANPYTAAIDVRQLTFGANTEKTVYLYNTGSFGQWAVKNGETTNDTTTTIPGQYIAIPQRVAASIGLPNDIPSMSGFLVKAMGAGGGSLTISYNSVVTKNVNPQRAPQLAQASDQVYLEITLKGKNYGDRVWLVNEAGTSHDFDNGWDGYKLFGAVGTPKLFAMEKDANYQISTTDDMNNTYLGFQAGVDLEDTLTFRSANVATRYSGIYLVDLVENKVIDITKPGTQYTFKAATTTAPIKRFKVVTQPVDSIPASSTPQLKVFNDNNIVFVDNSSSQKGDLYFYDIMGRFLKKETFGPNGISAFPLFSVTGAYIVKTVTSTEEVSKKIIIK